MDSNSRSYRILQTSLHGKENGSAYNKSSPNSHNSGAKKISGEAAFGPRTTDDGLRTTANSVSLYNTLARGIDVTRQTNELCQKSSQIFLPSSSTCYKLGCLNHRKYIYIIIPIVLM